MKTRHWSVVLAILSVAFVLFCAVERDSSRTVWGDESTYLAMAESLARDGDLRFSEADAARLATHGPSSRGTVILQRTASGIAYSKPVLYALAAAPGVLVAGDLGVILVNVGCLLVAAWLGWLFVCRLGERSLAAVTMTTFVGASVLLAHVGWRMSDLLQAALSLAGLVLALAVLRRVQDQPPSWLDRDWTAWLGGALLGLLISVRLPNGLIVVAVLAALVAGGRARRALAVTAAAVVAFIVMALASQALVGSANPYRAVRASFDAQSGYPLDSGDEVFERFETRRTTQRMTVVPDWRPKLTAYAALYFWIGRHTGVLWYFPAIVALLAAALRRPDRVTVTLLVGAAAAAGFYLVWWPENYFGGSAFLGNRYLLAVYPLLLVALPRLPGRLALTLSWVLAVVVGGSAVASMAAVDSTAAFSQSHTRAGLLARLPYESTARAIDGRRDRYWSGDLVRFVGPGPRVGAESFVLEPGDPAAEVLLVTHGDDTPILLRYRTRTPGLELVVEDRKSTQHFALAGEGRLRQGILNVPLAPSWRRHVFWWNPEHEYAGRMVRFSVSGGAEKGARVALWYGGDPAMLERRFEVLAPALELPSRVAAATTLELTVHVRNMSSVPWAATGAFPVTLSYRLLALADGEASLVEGPRIALPEDLPSGQHVALTLPIAWPETPGKYHLRLDLLIEHYAWFVDRRGESLAEAEIEVVGSGPLL